MHWLGTDIMAKRGKQKQKGKVQAVAKPVEVAPVEAAVVEQVTEVLVAAPEVELAPEPMAGDVVVEPIAEAVVADEAASGEIEAAPVEPMSPPDKPAAKAKSLRRVASRPRDRRSPWLVLSDYEHRSLAHIAGLPEQLDAPGLWRGVAYRIGGHRLASGFDEVLEILPMPSVTPIPGVQPWMLGVANIRGSLLPVVDLKQFLEGERTVLHERQRVLVVRQTGGDVAVTIDELYGQRSFVDAQGIDASATVEGRYAHFIDRAYRMNDQDWGVFSLERLARTPEFRQAAA